MYIALSCWLDFQSPYVNRKFRRCIAPTIIVYDNDHSSGDMAANVEKCAQIDDNLFGLLGRETIVQPRNDLRG